jgi:hypothetical protein
VAAVPVLQVGGYAGLDRTAGQLAVLVAEHGLQPDAGERDGAAVIGQRCATDIVTRTSNNT